MNHYYWNDLYTGWGWMLWIGFCVLFVASFGNWGYTYVAHRKFAEFPGKRALDILSERYAKGEINRQEYALMKTDISEKTHLSGADKRIHPTNVTVKART